VKTLRCQWQPGEKTPRCQWQPGEKTTQCQWQPGEKTPRCQWQPGEKTTQCQWQPGEKTLRCQPRCQPIYKSFKRSFNFPVIVKIAGKSRKLIIYPQWLTKSHQCIFLYTSDIFSYTYIHIFINIFKLL
jgi:hypothetical protein